MKLTRHDLKKLRWHALLAVLSLIVMLTLGYWSQLRSQQAKRDNSSAKNQLQQIDRRLHQVRNEEEDIKGRTTLFQQLEKSGMAGEEKRLTWIELLQALQLQQGLPSISYEFGPQRAIDTAVGADYAYHSSHLRLQLRLVHEVDLLNFTQQLHERANAMILLRSCRVMRATDLASLAQLTADCDMEWVTLRRANAIKQP